ncbi:hypothetical protein LRS13_20655 [Svornostia abyssi]|uniref:Uncharacterized protein n=1 Tax=Svornostia abyssi TaxID=2898438 RepID=A0ABY5PEL8_9ACTN|nr:hypothetical protein LRS13_20655 [Parviterribacteraceae bacterium J379]
MALLCAVPLLIAASILVLQGVDALLPAVIVALCAGMMVAMVIVALRG